MTSSVDQALYGYRDGHRLLASSIELRGDTGRRLRSATDMAFDGQSDTYLTSLPMPELRRHALIRSWPALEASRPGSVWSHVLLVDFVDLGELRDLRSLESLFVRPSPDRNGRPDVTAYSKAIPLPTGGKRGAKSAIAADVRELLLWATYEGGGPVRLSDPSKSEAALFELWAQQWPRLRRAFGFRTRHRVGDKANGYTLQVVERLQRNQRPVALPEDRPGWLTRLSDDLVNPNRAFRAFLHRYGAESERGVADVPGLTTVAAALEARSEPLTVVSILGREFKSGRGMAGLKRDLLGPESLSTTLPLSWSVREPERLRIIMRASPSSAFDLDELSVPDRLDDLWHTHHPQALALLLHAESFPTANKKAVRLLLERAFIHVEADDIPEIAQADPPLAVAILNRRPELLREPAAWPSADAEALAGVLEVFEPLATGEKEEVFRAVLAAGGRTASQEIVRRDPRLWWAALDWGGQALRSGRSLARTVSVIAELLDAAGPAGIGDAPETLDAEELFLLALAAPPEAGLWRHATAAQWAQMAEGLVRTKDPRLRIRTGVVLIGAAQSGATRTERKVLWRAGFKELYASLTEDATDDELAALDTVLRANGQGDPASRLRDGVIREAKRGDWSEADLREIVAAAGPDGPLIVDALRRKAEKKKKKSWWREILDQLAP